MMNDQTPIRRNQRKPEDEMQHIVGQLEEQIGQAVSSRHETTPKQLSDINKMAGDAVALQYEAAAKEIEAYGASLRRDIDQDADELLREIAETAEAMRERGKRAQQMVDSIGSMTNEARQIVANAYRKVGG